MPSVDGAETDKATPKLSWRGCMKQARCRNRPDLILTESALHERTAKEHCAIRRRKPNPFGAERTGMGR
eukprot:2439055-Prymnesium_polylepis.1